MTNTEMIVMIASIIAIGYGVYNFMDFITSKSK